MKWWLQRNYAKGTCRQACRSCHWTIAWKVRKEYWGYVSDENISIEDSIREKYKGIRPAPGYPACPEHSEKGTLFELLNASEATGVSLTENYAMYPAASVSGFYFSHPDSQYFNVGKLLPDQIEDYAKRKNMSIEHIKNYYQWIFDFSQ